MTKKIAIIGAGAPSIAAINAIFEQDHDDDCAVDVFDGRCDWGGRVKSLAVGDELIDFGAEAIENENSPWKALLQSATPNLEWSNLMSDAIDGLYWANGNTQTPENATQAEISFAEIPTDINTIINSRIYSALVDIPAATPQMFATSADLITGYMNYTSSESIEPWVYAADDARRFDSESSETYPVLSTTGKRLTLGASFIQLGRKLEIDNSDALTTYWNRRIASVEVSHDSSDMGFSLVDDNSLKNNGYAAVIITAPVPLLEDIQLPYTAGPIVEETIDGIELGHYLKIAWQWEDAINYLSEDNPNGIRVWLVDPDGQYLWHLQAFPESGVLVANTTGAYAEQCSRDLDMSVKMLESQLQLVFGGLGAPDSHRTYSWTRDPLATGCYSYCRAGHAENRQQFSKLYFPGIYFAGEASSLPFYGQLDGAYQSGVEAATNALAYLFPD